MTEKLKKLIDQAVPRSRYWLVDAVENAQIGKDDISEAADDFVLANRKTLGTARSMALVNEILVACGSRPVFN